MQPKQTTGAQGTGTSQQPPSSRKSSRRCHGGEHNLCKNTNWNICREAQACSRHCENLWPCRGHCRIGRDNICWPTRSCSSLELEAAWRVVRNAHARPQPKPKRNGKGHWPGPASKPFSQPSSLRQGRQPFVAAPDGSPLEIREMVQQKLQSRPPPQTSPRFHAQYRWARFLLGRKTINNCNISLESGPVNCSYHRGHSISLKAR